MSIQIIGIKGNNAIEEVFSTLFRTNDRTCKYISVIVLPLFSTTGDGANLTPAFGPVALI